MMGWFLFVLSGFAMGALGGGGSLFIVPVLNSFFGIPMVPATSGSVLIVGFISTVSGLIGLWHREIDNGLAWKLAIPGAFAVVAGRLVVFQLPAKIGPFLTDTMLKVAFGLLLLGVAMRSHGFTLARDPGGSESVGQRPIWDVFGAGVLVGLISGVVGAGGGFLLVPLLHHRFRLPMPRAVATSLWIIAIQSWPAMAMIAQSKTFDTSDMAWFMRLVIGVTLIGLWVGRLCRNRLPEANLRYALQVLQVVVAVHLLVQAGTSIRSGL